MQRAVDSVRERLVSGDRQERIRRLHRNLVFAEIVVIENLGVIECTLDHRLGTWLAILLEKIWLQRSGVDADTHRAAMILRSLDDFFHTLRAADIAGIDAQT